MREVLVIDDEKFIRLGLKAMLERNSNRYYDVTLCRDGLEALKILECNDFDIIITDIRMPEMSGLELIEKIKDYNNKPEIIILSGYDDFNFAIQALRNGAREYLLKPINRDILNKTLEEIENHLIEKQNKKYELKEYELKLNLKKLEHIILKDSLHSEELEEIINNIDIDILKGNYFLSVVTSNEVKNMQSKEGLELQRFINNLIKDEVMFLGPNNEIVLLSKEKNVINNIEKYIIDKGFYNFAIGVSELHSDGKFIKEAYNQAIKASKYKVIVGNCIVIEYCEVSNKLTNTNIPVEQIEKLKNIIGTDRECKICDIVDSILDKNIIKENDISYLEAIGYNINSLISNNINLNSKFENIYNFNTIDEYSCELKKCLVKISSDIRENSSLANESVGIKKALNYINKNYSKEITMAMVSNEVSLNYSYFSHVFKEHVGDNFINYLRKVRIDKAKELLETTDLKIYEVAEKVGYYDSKQFAKMFRKVSGLSPLEYREKYNLT